MLEEGHEYAVMLYTWRSCSRAIPQVSHGIPRGTQSLYSWFKLLKCVHSVQTTNHPNKHLSFFLMQHVEHLQYTCTFSQHDGDSRQLDGVHGSQQSDAAVK